MFTTLLNNSVPVLKSQLLSNEAGIIHFCTLRGCHDVSVSDEVVDSRNPFAKYNLCSYSGDSAEHVLESRKAYADALGIDVTRMWFPRQVHGTEILVVDSSMPDNQEADAVITLEKNLLIGVSTADCVPILLYDSEKQIVAAIHAGWRGTVAGIVSKTMAKLKTEFGCLACNVKAMIGPSISPEAFEVGDEVVSQFLAIGDEDCVISGYSKPHIHLWRANMKQLLQAGVAEENIDCTPLCTFYNSDVLFSARKLGIKSGRIISAIMMR